MVRKVIDATDYYYHKQKMKRNKKLRGKTKDAKRNGGKT